MTSQWWGREFWEIIAYTVPMCIFSFFFVYFFLFNLSEMSSEGSVDRWWMPLHIHRMQDTPGFYSPFSCEWKGRISPPIGWPKQNHLSLDPSCQRIGPIARLPLRPLSPRGQRLHWECSSRQTVWETRPSAGGLWSPQGSVSEEKLFESICVPRSLCNFLSQQISGLFRYY